MTRNIERRRATQKRYREKNREKILAAKRAHYNANLESERADRLLYQKNRPRQKKLDAMRLHQTGMSCEVYRANLFAQGGGCAICGLMPTGRSLHADHDHLTGKVRGLLCQRCNIGIGHLQDSIYLFKKAIVYLERYEDDTPMGLVPRVGRRAHTIISQGAPGDL